MPKPLKPTATTIDLEPLLKQQRRQKLLRALLGVVVLGIFAAVAMNYVSSSRTDSGTNTQVVETEAPVETQLPTQTDITQLNPIDESLLVPAPALRGVSVGYVDVSTASETLYDTLLFYRKNDDGDPQVFSYNIATSTEVQLTDDEFRPAYRAPLFSSERQQLVYALTNREANSAGLSCDTIIYDLGSSVSTEIDLELANKTCVSPVAWSPGSDMLLLESQERDLSERTGGLHVPYVYDVATATAREVSLPEGFDGLQDEQAAAWVSDTELALGIVQYDEFGDFVSNAVVLYDTETARTTADYDMSVMPRSIVAIDDQRFALAEDVIVTDEDEDVSVDGIVLLSDVKSRAVPQSVVTGSDRASSLIGRVVGAPGVSDAMDTPGVATQRALLYTVAEGDSTQAYEYAFESDEPLAGDVSMFALRGDQPTPVGWYRSYDELLYATDASVSELRVYNFDDKTDLLVARDLGVLDAE